MVSHASAICNFSLFICAYTNTRISQSKMEQALIIRAHAITVTACITLSAHTTYPRLTFELQLFRADQRSILVRDRTLALAIATLLGAIRGL